MNFGVNKNWIQKKNFGGTPKTFFYKKSPIYFKKFNLIARKCMIAI